MIALSQATTITLSVAGLFAPLAVTALVRSVLTREGSGWQRYRVGVFVERDERDPPHDDGGDDFA